jgi:serine/threonine-protein kinase
MERARYHVVSKIAHGGMAEIFLATQQGERGFSKPVVLKRILPSLARDPAFVRMLVDEAHIASTLNHSNLVQVLDLGRSGDQYFLVLEFVDGWSLEQIRRRAQKAKLKFPIPLALSIVGALCRGLAYVHTRERNGRALGIIHRDVTPQNVLISQHGEVKLADFGIAKAVDRSEKSAPDVIKGKFAYMSPEQTRAAPLDARSDLFSVGTVLYLLIAGKKPFDGATDLDVIMQVRKARPEKLSSVVKDLNVDVERLINRALRADPAKRWQSAEQIADKIDAILVKLGQPSGPAPLKRWLETLGERDGAKPPGADAAAGVAGAPPDPSIAIELGSVDLELQEVAPATTVEPADPAAVVDTRPERGRGGGGGPADVVGQSMLRTRMDAWGAAELARAERRQVLAGEEITRAGVVVKLRRWALRVAVGVVVLGAAIGGATYLALPHLPAWARRPIDNWLGRAGAVVGLHRGAAPQ